VTDDDDRTDDGDRDDGEAPDGTLGRRFRRATTGVVELGGQLRGHSQRLDLLVVVLGLAIVAGAARIHRRLVTPDTVVFTAHGLTMTRSAAWLAPEFVATPAPRLIHALPVPNAGGLPYHVELTSSLGGDARLEVMIEPLPPWSDLCIDLELDRRTRYGETYAADPGEVRAIASHPWLRTVYRYAYVSEAGDEPRIGHAVEYATVDDDHLYVVTFHGTPDQTARMEATTASSLRVEGAPAGSWLDAGSAGVVPDHPAEVDAALASTVMVVVADLADGSLRATGSGSGVVVGADGSILTNHHVVATAGGLHDLFVIARFAGPGRAPELVCAGHPDRAKLQPEVDLALLKCDSDLDGRALDPAALGWHALTTDHAPAVQPGHGVWVLGYPEDHGGEPTVTGGRVQGWTGPDGTAGHDYAKTEAAIGPGDSGGPVLDRDGHLVGLATAYRVQVSAAGPARTIGLVRPLAAAADLLAIVRAGWTPRQGHTAVELAPGEVAAPAATGVRLSTHVVDVATDQPVSGALLMVMRAGLSAGDVDMNRLDEQVLAWGRSSADGEVDLKQPVPVPGTYTVLVLARGYEPLVGDQELRLDAATPRFFDPWGVVRIQAR
jgi:S1-C subfamily serine protease